MPRRRERRRDPAKEAYWWGVVTRWRAGGRTGVDFCEKERVNLSSFYAWRRRFEREGRLAVPGAVGFVAVEVKGRAMPARDPAGRFLPVAGAAEGASRVEAEDEREEAGPGVEIDIAGRWIVRAWPGTDGGFLRQVLEVVEGLRCS